MTSLRVVLLIGGILATACGVLAQARGRTEGYPGVIQDAGERRAKAEREWKRLIEVYQLPQAAPDLHPIIYTPRSLPGAIKLMEARPQPGSEEIELREGVRAFIDRWRELLGTEPSSLSLVGADDTGSGRRLTYRQVSYPFPISGDYGVLTIIVKNDGTLVNLDDRLIPAIEVPLRSNLDRERAAGRVVGRTFSYSGLNGARQEVTISAPDEVATRQLVILPIEKAKSIEVRLAWEVIAGKSLAWLVYVDAINGEELKAVQQFAT
jgi:hypothetical protein